MAADMQALRQQIIAKIERCAELGYAAGHHFAQHEKHAPSSMMAQADAQAQLIELIESYADLRQGAERDELRALWLEWLGGLYDGPDLLRRVKLAVYGPLRKPASSSRIAGVQLAHELLEGRNSQHVLKAEGEGPDATDRENCVNASPDGGPMGVGQAAAAAPAGVAATHEARRWCKGDGEWTNWQPVSPDKLAERQADPTFEVRPIAGVTASPGEPKTDQSPMK